MKTLFVQLGRVGDILNILPLCWRDFLMTGERPGLMVARTFFPLLDGIDYVVPLRWDGPFEEIIPALRAAEKVAEVAKAKVVCTQIYGEGFSTVENCSSFVRESWNNVPGAPPWGSLPLVLPRDPERERAVSDFVEAHAEGKPIIILALSGTSSPFEHHARVALAIRTAFTDFHVADLSGFMASRFFDVLGLLEKSAFLVTVDSAWLHLAHACPEVPVAAFITREPSKWHGTAWRPQQVVRRYYDEAPDCIGSMVGEMRFRLAVRKTRPRTVIWHGWSHFESGEIDPETLRRMRFAQNSWRRERDTGLWQDREFKATDARRSSGDAPILDPRPIPFMKDVIEHAGLHAQDEDVVAFTNADVSFCPGLTGWVLDATRCHGAAHTHRWDFHEPMQLQLPSEAAVRRGEFYCGSDAFFFRWWWWKKHSHEYPDMIIGREQNDEVLRQLIKRHGGVEIPGAIYHEKHPSYWEHHGRRDTNPGNLYNRRLARLWFMKTGLRPNDPEWWKI